MVASRRRREMGKRKIIRCVKPHPQPIRCSRDFKLLINEVKAKYLLQNKKPPTTTKITDIIAKKIRMSPGVYDEFIRF